VEGAIMVMLLALFLSGAPVAVIAVTGGRPASAAQPAHRSARPAGDPPPAVSRLGHAAGTARKPSSPGTVIPGRFAIASGPPPAASSSPVLLGVIVVFLLANVLFVAGLAVHFLMEHRRLAAWAAEWAVTGPRWTTRR
jgi:hypothetical protein